MNNIHRKKAKSAPYINVALKREQHCLEESCSEDESGDSDCSERSLHKYHDYYSKNNKIKGRCKKTVKFTNNKSLINAQEISVRRHQMFLNFSKLQVEESLSIDFHRNLYAKFERTETILNALQQYIDCLNLELKASYRLCSEISGLVVNDNSIKMNEDVLHLIKKLCQLRLVDENNCVTNTILNVLQIDKDIDQTTKEYNRRKRDLNIATRNFRILLSEFEFNIPQMELLERQYEGLKIE